MNEETIRSLVLSDLAQALYEVSDDYDPAMPNLWQRGFMTREPLRKRAEQVLGKLPAYFAMERVIERWDELNDRARGVSTDERIGPEWGWVQAARGALRKLQVEAAGAEDSQEPSS